MTRMFLGSACAVILASAAPSDEPGLLFWPPGDKGLGADVAAKKAQTAANSRRATSVFQDATKSGPLNAIFTDATAVEGDELLLVDGKIISAIGVSGGAGVQDSVVARAGQAALR